MKSRKEIHRKNKKSNRLKVTLLIIFLFCLISSSIGVAFANEDIKGLLTSWFDQNRIAAVSEIEQAIMEEKEIQKENIRTHIQSEINKSKEQLNVFTQEEKTNRVQNIQEYGGKLIASIVVDTEEEKKQIINEIDAIMEDAIAQLNQVEITKEIIEDENNANGGESE